MNNKFSRRFQVNEPKNTKEYKIEIYPEEYEKYVDETKESYIKTPLLFIVNLEMIRAGHFNATGHFEGELLTHCSRCRDEATVDLSSKFQRVYEYSEYETEEDEDLIYYNTVYIDLFTFFIDEISLIIPSYNLCDKNCKGVCHICGENLNKNSCNHK
jgi:uncharacterized protein